MHIFKRVKYCIEYNKILVLVFKKRKKIQKIQKLIKLLSVYNKAIKPSTQPTDYKTMYKKGFNYYVRLRKYMRYRHIKKVLKRM